jgi:DNA ligase-1
MNLIELVKVSQSLSGTSRRLEKYEGLARFLHGLQPEEIPISVAYLSGRLPQGRIGIGPAALRRSRPTSSQSSSSLTLREVDRELVRITQVVGPGSSGERSRLLQRLLARATREEQEFLIRLILGDLRQGALEGIMVEALARATRISAQDVRRAVMVSGDLGAVARAALVDGAAGLQAFSIRLFHPLQPMLAQTANDVADALSRLDEAAFEYKLDGARIQVHKSEGEVRVFTRRSNDVTAAVPEIVEAVQSLPPREMIVDGEVLALREDGRPHPFQTTMRRFGRKLDIARMRESLPLTPLYFDCLLLNGESLIDREAGERMKALDDAVAGDMVIPRIVTSSAARAEAFREEALEAGHEGIMAKSLDASYEAGSRGHSWLKLKPAHTLDLVVLAAEWGSGRRKGWLSNLHLGARDPEAGGFVMLGKTFKGMTDEILAWQTKRLQELEISRDKWTVYVRPELVVEVAFSGVQASPQYPGGVALRFARIKRYRSDKTPGDTDTIDAVKSWGQA